LASLAIVLGSFGNHVTLEELRSLSGISRDGSSAALIAELARGYGLEAKGYKKDMAGLRDAALPAIAHCRFNHFVVIEEVRDDGVVINDPASGPRCVSVPDFSEDFTGVLLCFRAPQRLAQRPQPFRFGRAIATMLRPFRAWVALAAIASVLGWIAPLLVARSLLVWPDAARWLAYAAGVAALCAAIEHWALGALTARVHGANAEATLRKVAGMPAAFFSYRFPGTISGLVESYAAISKLTTEVGEAALGVLAVPAWLLACAMYSPRAAMVTTVFLMASVAVAARLFTPRDAVYRRFIHEGGLRPGLDPWRIAEIERLKLGSSPAGIFSEISGSQAISLNAAQAFGGASVLQEAIQTGLSLAMLLAIFAVSRADVRLAAACSSLALFSMARVRAAIRQWLSADRLRALLFRIQDLPEEIAPSPVENSGSFVIAGVTFGYNQRKPALLRDVSFELTPGKIVGFAGRPGSGRSTLARLICGLHAPWEGSVSSGGMAAFVQPHAPFFEGSLSDNITLWDAAISRESLDRSLHDACLDEVVSQRTDGIHAPVTAGATNFSGGQRQRLAIARALVRDPKLLILDEATDALDPDLEAQLIANLRNGFLARGGVCILIGLRPSTLALCDEMIVIENGVVAERGVPETLAAGSGAYSRLIRSAPHA
jgi:ABC-type bacteriocin/lantibiotic exporter with double-glycine peptidase domain